MKSVRNLFVFFLCLVAVTPLYAQTLLPRPEPPRLVNDLAGKLSAEQADQLERKLVAFDDSTSTQIAIVIVSDLQGYDRSEFAYKVASDWGVGRQGKDNGVLILVKPKTADSGGRAFIATGRGLEGVIPDILCGEIVDREMIPLFRQEDYYGGLERATSVLMALASKEFTADQYQKKGSDGKGAIPAGVIFVIILIVIIISSLGSNNRNLRSKGSSGLPFWLLMSMMGSGRSHGGSWGGFSGGGGGGFGGFGGGGFGGGGAGGSW